MRFVVFIVLCSLILCAQLAAAHDPQHEDDTPDEVWESKLMTEEPMDGFLWAHIFFMSLAFGVVYPVGVVLALARSRWHGLVQGFGTVCFVIGYFLGHAHQGRQFEPHNAHRGFAVFMTALVSIQAISGLYLKLHWSWGPNKLIRKLVVYIHRPLGFLFPVFGYVQMVLGGIVSIGLCSSEDLGQCLAHFIMGSSFVVYGFMMLIFTRLGAWFYKKKRAPELYDSSIILLWGIVNTFTERKWGTVWNDGDEHTSLGLMWFAGGALALLLSWSGKRNAVPALIILYTAYAMMGHKQHGSNDMISGAVHTGFGYTLCLSALARMVEVSFVHKDGVFEIHPWQYLSPMLIITAGFLFMGATDGQIAILVRLRVNENAWINVLISFAFYTFFFFNLLLHLYDRLTAHKTSTSNTQIDSEPIVLDGEREMIMASVHDQNNDLFELEIDKN